MKYLSVNIVNELDIVIMYLCLCYKIYVIKKDSVHEEIFCCNEGIWSEISI